MSFLVVSFFHLNHKCESVKETEGRKVLGRHLQFVLAPLRKKTYVDVDVVLSLQIDPIFIL